MAADLDGRLVVAGSFDRDPQRGQPFCVAILQAHVADVHLDGAVLQGYTVGVQRPGTGEVMRESTVVRQRRPADRVDGDLLCAWRGGDRAAGSELFGRHVRTLLRYFGTGRSLDASQLQELVQATMLACVESRERVPDGVAFRAYLLGIARRILANEYRAEHRRRNLTNLSWPATYARCPSQLVADRERERRLARALPMLREDLQLVVRLHYWEHMQTGDIARLCEIPKGTVKSRLRRARALLQQAIEVAR